MSVSTNDIEIGTRTTDNTNGNMATDAEKASHVEGAKTDTSTMTTTMMVSSAPVANRNGENNGNAVSPAAVAAAVAAAAAAAAAAQQQAEPAQQPQQQKQPEKPTQMKLQQVQVQPLPQQQASMSTAAPIDAGKMDDNDVSLTNFKVLYVLTQLCGLTLIVLMGSWLAVHMGGFGGTANPQLEFNWHPLLMTIGLIFLYGNSILVYRGFRNARKKTLKITHAAIHMGAFILTVIALKAVFDSHNLAATPIPNMYSLHSWLGLGAVLVFCMQYVAGFTAYLVPGMRESYRVALMPLHIYFGLFGFVLAVASALMGVTEKAIFTFGTTYGDLPNSAVIANMCGVLYVIFGGLVVYIATEPTYKRKPRPEDAVLLTGVNE